MTTKISCGGFDIDNDTLIEEDGVLKVKGGSSGGGVLVIHGDDNGVLDKTWQEIYDAANVGVVVLPTVGGEVPSYLVEIIHRPPLGQVPETWRAYFFQFVDGSVSTALFEAESADSYPVYAGE